MIGATIAGMPSATSVVEAPMTLLPSRRVALRALVSAVVGDFGQPPPVIAGAVATHEAPLSETCTADARGRPQWDNHTVSATVGSP